MSKPAAFDWMEVRRNPDHAKTDKARRESMYRIELEERAALLQRLGHGKDKARARLAANLEWDFAPGPSPVSPAALDAIVDRIFDQTPAGRAVPRPKGGTR
jgi:hypothetical protein